MHQKGAKKILGIKVFFFRFLQLSWISGKLSYFPLYLVETQKFLNKKYPTKKSSSIGRRTKEAVNPKSILPPTVSFDSYSTWRESIKKKKKPSWVRALSHLWILEYDVVLITLFIFKLLWRRNWLPEKPADYSINQSIPFPPSRWSLLEFTQPPNSEIL